MTRKHRSEIRRVGSLRTGTVMAYLIAADGQVPLLAVHTSASRALARGWAELSLPDAVQLAEHLNGLVTLAGYGQKGERA